MYYVLFGCSGVATPNLPTSIVGFRGFDSSTILNLGGEIPRPTGDLPESLSQAMLVGIMLVGRLGVVLLVVLVVVVVVVVASASASASTATSTSTSALV